MSSHSKRCARAPSILECWLRTVAFFTVALLWTTSITVCGTILLPLPRLVTVHYLRMWASVVLWLVRVIVGVSYEVRGTGHLRTLRIGDIPALFLCGHQSAWETIIFHLLVKDPCFFMKRELILIPFYGWLALKVGMISIKRDTGTKTLRKLLNNDFPLAITRMRRGQSVIFFPAGTRVPVGKNQELHTFVFALYKEVSAVGHPVYIGALNSGKCWPKKGPLRPGTITLMIHPMASGLSKNEFTARLGAINTLQDYLCRQ